MFSFVKNYDTINNIEPIFLTKYKKIIKTCTDQIYLSICLSIYLSIY